MRGTPTKERPQAARGPVRTPYTPAEEDPRVAKRGGTRNSGKGYEYPGMTDAASWRRSPVHKATRYYGCVLCGTKFKGSHAVYTHLAKAHDR